MLRQIVAVNQRNCKRRRETSMGVGCCGKCVKFCLTEKIFEEKTDRPRRYWRRAVKKVLIAKMPDTEF